jgi:hypothetical protein
MFAQAIELVKEMETSSIIPTHVIYTGRAAAFAAQGLYTLGLQVSSLTLQHSLL